MGWKDIGRLFIQIEDDEKKEAVAEVQEIPQEEVSKPQEASMEMRASSGQQNENIAESLAKSLEEANLEGYDYFEFAKTLEALKPTMPAEQTLYQTAFASGSVMGATKDKLIQTAQHYLDILGKKQEEFGIAVQQQTEATVTSKEQELATMDEQIKDRADKIQALTDEINAMTNQKTEMVNEISANKVKIEQVKNDFAATLQVFVSKISRDMERIEKYLGTPTQAPAK